MKAIYESNSDDRINIINIVGASVDEKTGSPHCFLRDLLIKAHDNNVAVVIRAGKPFQLYEDRCAPKPSSVKAKSCNWGFLKGVIAVDDIDVLGKMDSQLKVIPLGTNETFAYAQQHDDRICIVTHRIPLKQILDGIESGEFVIIGEKPNKNNSRLVVQPTDGNAPFGSEVLFSVDLAKHEKPDYVDNSQIYPLPNNSYPKPDWWPDHINFDINYRFQAQYKKRNDNTVFRPIKIYGCKTEVLDTNNHIIMMDLPVTGDMDLLWLTRPWPDSKDVNPACNKVLNTHQWDQMEIMYKELLKLQLNNKFEISDRMIAHQGCITPFESMFIAEVNESVSHDLPNIFNLFQHGAENHNPGTPSSMDGGMLHVWEGNIVLTENENELIDFVLTAKKITDESIGYMDVNYFDVHPKWNMDLWQPVVVKQLTLGQPVPRETELALVQNLLNTGQHHYFDLTDISKAKIELWASLIMSQMTDDSLPKNLNNIKRFAEYINNLINQLPGKKYQIPEMVVSHPILHGKKNYIDVHDYLLKMSNLTSDYLKKISLINHNQ